MTLRDHGVIRFKLRKHTASEDGEGDSIKQLKESENGITFYNLLEFSTPFDSDGFYIASVPPINIYIYTLV